MPYDWQTFENGHIAETSIAGLGNVSLSLYMESYNDALIKPSWLIINNWDGSESVAVSLGSASPVYIPPFANGVIPVPAFNVARIVNNNAYEIGIKLVDQRVSEKLVDTFRQSSLVERKLENEILLHFDEDFVSRGNLKILQSQSGSPVIDTSSYKFNGGSLKLPATADSLTLSFDDFTADEITMDFWLNLANSITGTSRTVVGANYGAINITKTSANSVNFQCTFQGASSLNAPVNTAGVGNSWIHFAYITFNGKAYMYVNGIEIDSENFTKAALRTLRFGNTLTSTANSLQCNIDEFRIRKGAMWTSSPNAVPTTPYI